jgi:hypothetical protein
MGRDDRPGGITGASGELAPEVREWLKKHGITEGEFRTAAERTAQARRDSKADAHLAEWDKIMKAHFAYEKRKREREAASR